MGTRMINRNKDNMLGAIENFEIMKFCKVEDFL